MLPRNFNHWDQSSELLHPIFILIFLWANFWEERRGGRIPSLGHIRLVIDFIDLLYDIKWMYFELILYMQKIITDSKDTANAVVIRISHLIKTL